MSDFRTPKSPERQKRYNELAAVVLRDFSAGVEPPDAYTVHKGIMARLKIEADILDGAERLEKAVSVVKQGLAVKDGRVVKNDCKFVGTHGSGYGLI